MNRRLFWIKLVHTLIWLFFVSVIGYILYAGIFDKIDLYVFIAVGLVFLEGIILMIFRLRCPLTVIAFKYTDSREPNFDIFLPRWLAEHNKSIFTTIFVMGLVIVLIRMIKI